LRVDVKSATAEGLMLEPRTLEAGVVEAARSRLEDAGFEWVKKGRYPS